MSGAFRINALVRVAKLLLRIGAAADYVRKAACRKAEALIRGFGEPFVSYMLVGSTEGD
ncbi:MAG TPA: hypothetical protein VIE66_18630 [Methylocella sp.]|jgi:hypothetical protein